MARKADPFLESAIVNAAVRLLDKEGLEAVTMRDVAKAAGTTTPTLYERFSDRDALLVGVLEHIAQDIRARMEATRSVKGIGEAFLGYCSEYPNRFNLIHRVWPPTLPSTRPRPTFQLTVERLQSQYGHSFKQAQEIASAIMSILVGTSVFMLGSGANSKFATRSRRIGMKAFEAVCKGI